MFFYITVSAKEKTILQKFLNFFSKINVFATNVFNQKSKKNTHKFVTVLKSPHINKTAQEQFEFKVFTIQITLSPVNLFLFFKVLKRILKNSFPGLKIFLLQSYANNKKFRHFSTNLNPDFIKINFKTLKKKVKLYFFTFDSFGEVNIQKHKINSFKN